jgi:hypothetical protein
MGFKREKRNSGGAREERTERGSSSSRRDRGDRSERRSNRSSSGAKSEFAFTNIGSVKQGRNLSDKDAAELKGCGESVKIKLYMPKVAKLVLEKDAIIGINLGKRNSDEDYVIGHATLPLGSLTPTKKTADDLVDFLGGMGDVAEYDFVAQIYLPKGIDTVALEHGKMMLVTFKTGEKAEDLEFVLGTLSLANDNSEE